MGPHHDGELIAQAASFSEDLVLFDTDATAQGSGLRAQDSEIKATWDALVLGTRDYVRKCGFSKALVGLSGTNAQISGHEFGVRLDTATGVPIRYGINVDNYGPHTATGMDTAISIMGGTAGGSH